MVRSARSGLGAGGVRRGRGGVPQGALEEDQDNQRTGKDQQGIEKEIKSVGRIPER